MPSTTPTALPSTTAPTASPPTTTTTPTASPPTTTARRPGASLKLAALAALAVLAAPAAAVDFRPTDRIIPSTSGGISGWAGYLGQVWEDAIDRDVANGRRLQHAVLLLSGYQYRDLDAALLEQLDRDFALFRAKGIKVILRAEYEEPTGWYLGYRASDAPLAQVLRHIGQLAPILRRHADVIGIVQAGFVGAWGEWHSSANRLDSEPAASQIRDALLAAVPDTVPVQFRTPDVLASWYPTPDAVPAASNGGARIGLHNDCMLSGSDDSYTFPSQASRDYAARLGARGPYGGETCTQLTPRTQCADILSDAQTYRMTYLSAYGALAAFQPGWQAQGCWDTIRRTAGPRIEMVGVTTIDGDPGTVLMDLRNVGWSPIHDNHRLVVRLTAPNGMVIDRYVAYAQPRTWAPVGPAGAPMRLDAVIEVDATMPAGTYAVSIGLPDAAPALEHDGRYALPFANDDDPARGQRTDPATGFLHTGLTLRLGR